MAYRRDPTGGFMQIQLSALSDQRLLRVSALTGLDHFAVMGRALALWSLVYRRLDDRVLVVEANNITGNAPGFVEAFIAQGLADIVDEHTIRIKGGGEVIDRIVRTSQRNAVKGRRSWAAKEARERPAHAQNSGHNGRQEHRSSTGLSTGYPQVEMSLELQSPAHGLTAGSLSVNGLRCELRTEPLNQSETNDKNKLSTGYPQSESHISSLPVGRNVVHAQHGAIVSVSESVIHDANTAYKSDGNCTNIDKGGPLVELELYGTTESQTGGLTRGLTHGLTAGQTDLKSKRREDPRSEDSGRSTSDMPSQNALRPFANAHSVPNGTARDEDDSSAIQVANQPSQEPSDKPLKQPPAEALRLATLLVSLITSNNPACRVARAAAKDPEKTVRTWADPIAKLERIDAMCWTDIEEMIRWSQKHQFWSSVILSGANLREKWDQMAMQRRRDAGRLADGSFQGNVRRPQRAGPTEQARREVEELEALERAAEADRKKGPGT